MHSLDQTSEARRRAETAEAPWRQTPPPRLDTADEPPRKHAPEGGDRRFLTALLRALSVWCT